MYDFYTSAHSGTITGKALLQMRMRARPSHRMRAMGLACIAIDVGLGLLGTLSTHSQVDFQAMADEFPATTRTAMQPIGQTLRSFAWSSVMG